MKRIIVSTAVVSQILVRGADAHPGHGMESGVGHFLTSPYHVITGLAIAFLATVLVLVRRSRKRGERT